VLKRYLMVVGIILAALVGLGVWLKPPLDKMREGVEAGLSAYARNHLKPGETMPSVTHTQTHDWLVAVSHTARVGDLTFYCYGAFKVTYCNLPEE
jgi:hypothetical protein